ncbi:LysR family transcriptional regulator [Variovorax sp. ZS18.2.2]|uniref:LysR family transcriptional regulator n=1 Tax=Variovorax sp. ZS18.2.2 TaxID=2971255 RepID=UPI002150FB43|nr:LysR family transcriptional regulator [Variovorax sp. ZS18.2.2]MCR6476226.1 LysR family transcriptional regulator [Variovorax sp. ZS18.2.2]
MDKLSGLLAFVKTADLGSFVAAGRSLELSASAIGKAVARLEHEVGVRLLQRSTRRIQLTEEGRLFHERCRRILDDLTDAQAMLSQVKEVPRGRLRISAPIVGYHFLLPVIPDFASRYPEVELDINFTDRTVDLIDERVDVAIRSGDLPDSRLVSRPLNPFRLLLCASPGYLMQHGTPRVASDLERHATVRFRHPNSGKLLEWPMLRSTADAEIRLRTVLACNNMEAVLGATLRGMGIACMPDFLARDMLANGRLLTVLEAELNAVGQFNAIWPSRRYLSPKVRVFVDHLCRHLSASGEDSSVPTNPLDAAS